MRLLQSTLLLISAAFSLRFQAISQDMQGMQGAEHHHHDDAMTLSKEQLGSVHFPVSCTAGSQKDMERGVALLHSFGYVEAERQFRHVAEHDEHCAMAHWGIAMTQYHEIWGRPESDAQKTGAEEMKKAETLGKQKPVTAREHGYIDALNTFFTEVPSDYQKSADDYTAAMKRLHEANPRDVEAAAFYALAVLGSERPDDTSLQPERTALGVLLPLFQANPEHPGLAHYIIHTCDTPQLALQGLDAAKVYAKIAPSSAHALHMPGHIFARLGLWQEDINSNLASQRASLAAEASHTPGAAHQIHADEFLIYAYLQLGEDPKAAALMNAYDDVCKRMDNMPGMDDMKGSGAYRANAMHAVYSLELHDWKGAEALEPLPTPTPYGEMITYWARAIGAGHLHDAAKAKAALYKVDTFLSELRKGARAYQAEGLEVYRNEMAGWSAYAENNNTEAVRLLRLAADKQDKLGQGEVDIPAREMLADVLLLQHRPQEALAEYQTALQLSPNRLNGLLGAGEAAEQVGDRTAAGRFYAKAGQNTRNAANSRRPELLHAISYIHSVHAAISPMTGF